MYDYLIAPFVDYSFMQRALIGSLALAAWLLPGRRFPDAAAHEP